MALLESEVARCHDIIARLEKQNLDKVCEVNEVRREFDVQRAEIISRMEAEIKKTRDLYEAELARRVAVAATPATPFVAPPTTMSATPPRTMTPPVSAPAAKMIATTTMPATTGGPATMPSAKPQQTNLPSAMPTQQVNPPGGMMSMQQQSTQPTQPSTLPSKMLSPEQDKKTKQQPAKKGPPQSHVTATTPRPASVTRATKDSVPIVTPVVERAFCEYPPVNIADEVDVAMDGDDDAMPRRYKGLGPSMEGEITPLFQNGYGFLIEDFETDTTAFYNDTNEYELHVEYHLGPRSKIEPGKDVEVRRDGEGWIVYKLAIYPNKTSVCFRGVPNGYRRRVCLIPITDFYREMVARETRTAVEEDIKEMEIVVPANCNSIDAALTCIAEGCRFIDKEFKPCQESIARSFEPSRPVMAWQRPQQYLPPHLVDSIALFNKVEPNDIDQGALGDCWFLCAMSCLAEFPELIEKLFDPIVDDTIFEHDTRSGAYFVRLLKDGWWNVVVVDDYFPVMGGKAAFACNRDDPTELWVAILEKAFAKLHGSYAAIAGGNPAHALRDLTGFPATGLEFADEDLDKLYNYLEQCDQKNYMLTFATPGIDTSSYNVRSEGKKKQKMQDKYAAVGLACGHAYSVISVKSFPKKGLRLLKVRNPWGNSSEWTGKWSDRDDAWLEHPDVAEACGWEIADDGTFWMAWEDVTEYFEHCNISYANDYCDWRAKGKFEGGVPTVALAISADEPVDVYVTLSQPDMRGQDPESKGEAVFTLLSVVETEGNVSETKLHASKNAEEPATKPAFSNARDISLKLHVKPGHLPSLVVPRVYKGEGRTTPYILAVRFCSDAPVPKVQPVRLPDDYPLLENYRRFEAQRDRVKPCRTDCQKLEGTRLSAAFTDTFEF